jgi:YHS domain-containing protein
MLLSPFASAEGKKPESWKETSFTLEELKKGAKTFRFCSPECKKAFEKDPDKYLGKKKAKKGK